MSLEGNAWGDKFGDKAAGALAAFMSTYNMVAQSASFDDENCQHAGGGDCTINGVYYPALTAEVTTDWSDTATTGTSVAGDALGTIVYDGYMVYLAVFANYLGRMRVDLASPVFLDADIELKIPWFDPTTWCCIAIGLMNAGSTITLGTTDINSETTMYQVIGPVLPHPDNLKI
jgi:hypothetical protein